MRQVRRQKAEGRKTALVSLLFAFCFLLSDLARAADTAAQAYDPPWDGEMSWVNGELFARPVGSYAYLDNNSSDSNYLPWWETRVAHPIQNYDATLLPAGSIRLDSAFLADVTFHRLLPGWSKQTSPTGIDNVYTFTPGSHSQEDQTARSGQAAFFDLGLHPTKNISGDIATELVGNYNQAYWFPVNDEHRMFNGDRTAKIVRGEIKYDDGNVMLRGFEGVPHYDWLGKNDLFHLLPMQTDVEYYRRISGDVSPRGGEFRVKSALGTLDVLGGTQPRWTYGSGVYARYDAPVMRNLEQSLVYRNENIPWGFEDPNERRWTVSYNASYPFSDRWQGHAGLLYQPFRLNRTYQEVDASNNVTQETTKTADAFGATARTEYHPTKWIDLAGLGYTYLGPVAGDKQQVDADASRTVWTDWTFSGAYTYRQPIKGPVPLLFQGTQANPGALIAEPRGPDDPFRVDWDNRQAHILSLTMVYDPTPGTPFFKYQRNLLEDWNYNPEEDATWVGVLQYRLTHYPTNTDRLYYYDEEHNLIFDPTFHTGALSTTHPFSSATGLLRWKHDEWHVTGDLSGGEALAGAAIAYTPATNFYKPSTVYMSGGLSVDNSLVKAFFRYSQDVWGPLDYATQLGWTYHKIYQAGLSLIFLKNAEVGFRYTGTRMTNEFIGSDIGAFNEYTFFLTYHFSLEHDFAKKIEAIGRPLPQTFPEVKVVLSETEITPDGSGPHRTLTITPEAFAESGILSWKLFIRNVQGDVVRQWEGNGALGKTFQWEGLGLDGKPLPVGTYWVTANVVDLYGNEAASPSQTVQIRSGVTPPVPVVAAKAYTLQTTAEGLRVTLSSLVLFDVNKYDLKDSAKEGLKQVVELLRAYPTNALRISGYTDATGSEAYNQALSERRAQAVADYLVRIGKITMSRVKAVGYGKRRSVATNATEEGRQANRRVEIDILK